MKTVRPIGRTSILKGRKLKTKDHIDFFKQVEQMREAGYAVAIFTPDELGTYGAKDLENLMVAEASEELARWNFWNKKLKELA